MTLKDQMMLYGITLGKRKNKKQRYLFAKQVKEVAENLHLDFEVVGHRTQRYNVENIHVGNLKKADVVLVAPYDTPSKSLIPVKYYPFHTALTLKSEQMDIAFRGLLSVVFIALAMLGIEFGKGTAVYLSSAVFALCAVYFMFPLTNAFNFNRYSAAVSVAMDVLEKTKGKNVAVIFADKITKGYDGYRLVKEHVSAHQKVIVLDAISAGEKLVVAHDGIQAKMAEEFATLLEAINKHYSKEKTENNVLAVLSNSLFITSGSIENGELVVRNTRSKNDIKLDINRLEKISSTICSYIK